jgi:hypothetical protein
VLAGEKQVPPFGRNDKIFFPFGVGVGSAGAVEEVGFGALSGECRVLARVPGSHWNPLLDRKNSKDSLGGYGFGRKKNLGIFVAGVPDMGMPLI